MVIEYLPAGEGGFGRRPGSERLAETGWGEGGETKTEIGRMMVWTMARAKRGETISTTRKDETPSRRAESMAVTAVMAETSSRAKMADDRPGKGLRSDFTMVVTEIAAIRKRAAQRGMKTTA